MTRPTFTDQKLKPGFTIVELVLVITVLGILAIIGVISYNGIQLRAHNLARQDDLITVETQLEYYAIRNEGVYPATTNNPVANWKTIDVRTDSNCFNGSAQVDWVPGFTSLPQSVPNINSATGVDGNSGCYLYASNGTHYVLSAWNMLSVPQTTFPFYRRLGFRQFQTSTSTQFYSCNSDVIGGANGSSYDITQDYYKHSFTISNITDCDETPPSGA
ncbi:type II secretion system protein [Candidatus Saccharibacteria bacterium]|nr:type II secretion system protein [Candidatus Saccharibacteria bacterium]